jgi:hypothetical protein
MGILWSHPQPNPQPTLPIASTTAHVVAYQSVSMRMGEDTTDIWIYQSRINMLPITNGQRVAIYRNAADAFNPGTAAPGVVEGKIGSIVHCNNNWVTFHIENTVAGAPTLLCIPSSVTNLTLYNRIACHIANIRRYIHLSENLPLPTQADQTRQSTPSFFSGSRDIERGEGRRDLVFATDCESTEAIDHSAA